MATLGEALNSLVMSLPQVMMLAMVYRLIFNELIHITVEPFKPPEEEKKMDEKILEAVRYHENVYGRPASHEYVASYVYMEPARKMVDEWVAKEKDKMEKVRRELEEMTREGRIIRSDGGYSVP